MNGTKDSKPFKGYFKNWRIVDYTDGSCIWGTFAGHERFGGKFGHSSKIVSVQDNGDHLEIETLNSIYKLNHADKHIKNNV